MIWVEFMGPSGVGKSYWYRKIADRFPQWVPETLLAKRIRTTTLFSELPLKARLAARIGGMGIAPQACNAFLIAQAKKYAERKGLLELTDAELGLAQSFLEGIQPYDPLYRLQSSALYLEKLKHLKFCDRILEKNELYLSEDGVLHLNKGYHHTPPSEIRFPDAIFYFNASESYIFENRIKRKRSGKSSLTEAGKTDEVLRELNASYVADYKQKVQYAIARNIETFTFDVAAPGVEAQIFEAVAQIGKPSKN